MWDMLSVFIRLLVPLLKRYTLNPTLTPPCSCTSAFIDSKVGVGDSDSVRFPSFFLPSFLPLKKAFSRLSQPHPRTQDCVERQKSPTVIAWAVDSLGDWARVWLNRCQMDLGPI